MKKTNNKKSRRESQEVKWKDETLEHGWNSGSPGFIKMDIEEKEVVLKKACMRSVELEKPNGSHL